jgi:hypothetical protein
VAPAGTEEVAGTEEAEEVAEEVAGTGTGTEEAVTGAEEVAEIRMVEAEIPMAEAETAVEAEMAQRLPTTTTKDRRLYRGPPAEHFHVTEPRVAPASWMRTASP